MSTLAPGHFVNAPFCQPATSMFPPTMDEVSGWWNVKLVKCQVDEMPSWWNAKLMKCQVDEMPSWWNAKLMKCQVDEMSIDKTLSWSEIKYS